MLTGIVAGLLAGALWGLTFVAPRAVQPYGEVDLAILRYLAFGFTSLALMAAHRRFRPGKLTRKRVALALVLGLTGYVFYYLFAAFSIRLAGPAIAPLVIGALPVVLAVYGNWQDRTVGWLALAPPLLLIAVGLGIVNIGTLRLAEGVEARSDVVLGFLLALGALGVWFVYAILNARAMRAADAPGALAWTSLQGLGAMLGVFPLILMAPLLGWSRVPELGVMNTGFLNLLFWSVAMGVIASWVAQYCWTVASQKLPLALSAQMIVSETLFALLYGFIYEARWPYWFEWTGGILLVAGVAVGVRAFGGKASS
jgi:drug/metabolite transporter (DMT)-like permease